jgi:hypothetical protein
VATIASDPQFPGYPLRTNLAETSLSTEQYGAILSLEQDCGTAPRSLLYGTCFVCESVQDVFRDILTD